MCPKSTMIERVCEKCGTTFSRSASQVAMYGGRFCSRTCVASSRRTREMRACEHCGAAFEVGAWVVKQGNGRWCSRACADIGRRAGEQRTCKVCGVQFYVYPSTLVNHGRTNDYCSSECYYTVIGQTLKGRAKTPEHSAAISRAKTGKPIPKRRKPPTHIQCQNCGTMREFSGRTYLVKINRFCSSKCWYAYVRSHPEESGHYIGGTCYGLGPNWKDQARKARERDDHTCQDCGLQQLRPRLDVHHVNARRNFNGDWRAANDLHNLVTLCKPCHTQREAAVRAAIRAVKK